MRRVEVGVQRQGGLFAGNSGWVRRNLVSTLKGFLGLSLLCASQQAVAAQAVPPAHAPAQAAQTVDAFRQQADKLGVKTCADLFSAMGHVVSLGSTYAVQVQTDGKRADKHPVQGIAGLTYNSPQYTSQAAGIVMAAPAGDACEGQLVRVAPFQKPCAEVAGLLPQGSTVAGNLSGVPLYNLGGNQGQALMVANGPSCVVVTIARMADAK